MKWLPGMLSEGFEENLLLHPIANKMNAPERSFDIPGEQTAGGFGLSRLRTYHLFSKNRNAGPTFRQIPFVRQRARFAFH